MDATFTESLRRIGAACAAALALSTAALAQQPAASAPAAPASASGNVYAAGPNVRPGAHVQGDYVAAAARAVLDQPVTGDVALAGGSVEVRAPVGDDLRVTGGDVTVDSSVGGELLVAGGNVVLSRNASVAKSARIFAGNVRIEGRIDGDLKGSAETVVIDNEVKGNVDIAASHLELGPNARIGGELRYASANEMTRAPGASIGGAVTRRDEAAEGGARSRHYQWQMRHRTGGAWVGTIVFTVGLLVAGALLLLALPGFTGRAAERVRSAPLPSLGLGLVVLVTAPVAAVLLFITILGIPLGLVLLTLIPVTVLLGILVGVACMARLLPPVLKKAEPASWAERVGYFAVALVAVVLLGKIPMVGWLLFAGLMFAGIGAAAMEIAGRRSKPTPPADGTPAAPVTAAA